MASIQKGMHSLEGLNLQSGTSAIVNPISPTVQAQVPDCRPTQHSYTGIEMVNSIYRWHSCRQLENCPVVKC